MGRSKENKERREGGKEKTGKGGKEEGGKEGISTVPFCTTVDVSEAPKPLSPLDVVPGSGHLLNLIPCFGQSS